MSLKVTTKVVQVMKDQAPKCSDSTAKSLRDSASASSSSPKLQAWRFSAAFDSPGAFMAAKKNEKLIKQAEESLRTVMYLSCWGPN